MRGGKGPGLGTFAGRLDMRCERAKAKSTPGDLTGKMDLSR